MKFRYILSALLIAGLAACNDTDNELFDSEPVDSGTGTLQLTTVTVNELQFKWEPVKDVMQYGYTLRNASNIVVRNGVTKQTSIAFENLDPDTKYTLTIEAFGANGSPTRVFTLEAKTDALIVLATPDMAQATVVNESAAVTLTWPAVEGADHYEYLLATMTDVEVASGVVDTNELVLSALPIGFYKIDITATSDYAGYLPSETATLTFERPLTPIASFVGHTEEDEDYAPSYDTAITFEGEVRVDQFAENQITVYGWMGAEGYDLVVEFDDDDNITSLTPVVNGAPDTPVTSGFAAVYTGSEEYYYAQIYVYEQYVYAGVDAEEGSGYVFLSGYFYDSSSTYVYAYYYLTFDKTGTAKVKSVRLPI